MGVGIVQTFVGSKGMFSPPNCTNDWRMKKYMRMLENPKFIDDGSAIEVEGAKVDLEWIA